MGEARSLGGNEHLYIMSLVPAKISGNSAKSDTEAIPISCLLQVHSLLVGNDTKFIKAVERNSDEEG
jgi:hypothetical protein